jgi:hypothetical protein
MGIVCVCVKSFFYILKTQLQENKIKKDHLGRTGATREGIWDHGYCYGKDTTHY